VADTEPDFTLANSTLAIIGLGLMGGSLALALRGKCRAVLAADPNPTTQQLARQFRVVDEICASPADILPRADFVILAAPVQVILSQIANLPSHHPGSPVVMDIGSTKTDIVAALDALPPRFDPIGGHPMTGKETAGLGSADADLYRGAAFALTPLARSTRRARMLAEELVQSIGAHPLWLDAETHDAWVAATSHLPYLVAAALALATPEEVHPLVGPGFRSTSRVAGSDPRMMRDILLTNRAAVLAALDRYKTALSHLETLLATDSPNLEDQMRLAKSVRNRLTR